jgi:hypothetical protein
MFCADLGSEACGEKKTLDIMQRSRIHPNQRIGITV